MNFVNAFQKIALSLGVLFFGIGVFIYSISPAQADNPTTVNNSGKVQMAMDGFVLNGKAAFHILVWDSETGKSKTYIFDGVKMAGEQLVTKMKVEAYTDIKFGTAISGYEFELQVNPSEVQFSFGIGFNSATTNTSSNTIAVGKETAIGGNASPQVFTGYKCPDLTVETIIDATGVLPPPTGITLEEGGKPSVQPYIELIKKVMYSWQSEEHGPAFLKVSWGKVFPTNSSDSSTPDGIYRCQLEDLTIKYVLFSATGNPVRAEISMKFIGVEDPVKAAEGYSPDLSHLIEVKYGDNLPAMCKKIYGSPEFFLQIAKVNNLPSIYAIEPGMKLVFPPLEKASR